VRAALPLLLVPLLLSGQDSIPKFGTTVVASSWFRGNVYHLHSWTRRLPNFKKLKPVGTVYTPELNVTPQAFNKGFPGITRRFEFFGIDYSADIWIEKPGRYQFSLISDDGADLYVDGNLVIDNDGEHMPIEKLGEIALTHGRHSLRVPYYQGPKYMVALMLKIQGPSDDTLRILNTENFKPPDGQF
jgi:hypothetical protein